MITGIETAASAARNAGARKLIRDYTSASASEALARQEIREQRAVERLRRVEHRVIRARLADPFAEDRRVLANQLLVLLAQVFRDHRQFLAGLHVDEIRG